MASDTSLINIREIKEIPVNKIKSSKIQVRSKNVEANIDSLTNSMRKFGLLNSITVYEIPEGYELVTGQRRLRAAKSLGWESIRATIIEKPNDELISKAISFLENEIREEMTRVDVINACNEFYHKYGSIKTVSEELALPYELVKSAVNLPRAPQEVQKAVKEGEIDLRLAMKATDALRWDSGDVESGEKVLELAHKMQSEKMPRNEIEAVTEVAKSDPSQKIDTIISKARTRKKIVRHVELLVDEDEQLSKYAEDEKMSSKDEAAADLVIKGLVDRGYIQK